MLTWDAAQRLFARTEAETTGDSGLEELKDELIEAAVRYARIRTDWQMAPPPMGDIDSREELGVYRTSAHKEFILACDVLARAMGQCGRDASWRVELGQDRKQIGDWACYVHCLLGMQAR